MSLSIGSLFSGIGGLELGLERAGFGPVHWQVEIDPKCRAALATHWPEAKRYEDVCKVGAATLAPVDIVCGGFPCQDISSAGKRAGLAGDRSGLWYHFARIVAECRPRWVVIENVRSGARKYVDDVRRELGRIGYASLPIPISAGDCGAPHERARVFIVACSVADAMRERCGPGLRGESSGAAAEVAATIGARVDASDSHSDVGATELASARANVDSSRQPQQSRLEPTIGRWPLDADRIWTVEPDVARVVHGFSGRVDRERALGNSVVPQCAEVIGHVIRQLIGEPHGH